MAVTTDMLLPNPRSFGFDDWTTNDYKHLVLASIKSKRGYLDFLLSRKFPFAIEEERLENERQRIIEMENVLANIENLSVSEIVIAVSRS